MRYENVSVPAAATPLAVVTAKLAPGVRADMYSDLFDPISVPADAFVAERNMTLVEVTAG